MAARRGRGGVRRASSGAAPFVGVLDQMSASPRGAWCVFDRLRAAYTGPLIRVRRASDNALADIGYDPATNRLDTAALAAHCGASDGFVETVYDQSGNGRNLTQSTNANQPRIYLSASGVIRAGVAQLPAMRFDGTNTRLTRSDSLGVTGHPGFSTWFSFVREGSSTADKWVSTLGTSSGGTQWGQMVANPGTVMANSILNGVRSFNPAENVFGSHGCELAAGAGIGTSTWEENGTALAQVGVLNGANTPNLANTSCVWGSSSGGTNTLEGLSSWLFQFPVLAAGDKVVLRAWAAARI